MRFTVTWHRSATDELARIWAGASDRRAVTDAANQIDVDLSRDPEDQGEEFYGDRLLVVAPLAVTYSISHPDLRVLVLQVWHQ